MKYKLSKFKEDLKDGEEYYTIRYQYNDGKFRVNLSAKDKNHARERFINETFGDWCKIDEIIKSK